MATLTLIVFTYLIVLNTCVLHQNQAFTNGQKYESRIVGGFDVKNRSEFAYQASIRYNKYHMCGGSIINADTVLTAAHCCFDADGKVLKTKNLDVVVGNLYQNQNALYIHDVKKIIYNTDYNPDILKNDIAIMKISKSFSWNKDVQPITLTKLLPPPNTRVNISGWGSTIVNRETRSYQLKYATVNIFDLYECKRLLGDQVLKGMFCAGLLTGGVDSCQGDSGGPVVYSKTLVGIVSWGYGCARPRSPGVYTDISQYLEWIKRNSSATTKSPLIITYFVTFLLTLLYRKI